MVGLTRLAVFNCEFNEQIFHIKDNTAQLANRLQPIVKQLYIQYSHKS